MDVPSPRDEGAVGPEPQAMTAGAHHPPLARRDRDETRELTLRHQDPTRPKPTTPCSSCPWRSSAMPRTRSHRLIRINFDSMRLMHLRLRSAGRSPLPRLTLPRVGSGVVPSSVDYLKVSLRASITPLAVSRRTK